MLSHLRGGMQRSTLSFVTLFIYYYYCFLKGIDDDSDESADEDVSGVLQL
jgi:hypothetical protein